MMRGLGVGVIPRVNDTPLPRARPSVAQIVLGSLYTIINRKSSDPFFLLYRVKVVLGRIKNPPLTYFLALVLSG